MMPVTNVLLLSALAMGLVAGLVLARSVLPALPLRRANRDAAMRSLPVVGLGVVVLYVLYAVQVMLRGAPELTRAAQGLIVAGTILAAWPALRDMLAGVVIKSGGVCQPGDHVTLDGVSGRVIELGLRAMVLETASGHEAVIPYHRVSTASVVRTPVHGIGALHVFTVSLDPGLSPREAGERARQAALGSHWAVAGREPVVEPGPDGTLQISVVALHADYRADVERAVRIALGAPADRS